jgi:hypothetical protein
MPSRLRQSHCVCTLKVWARWRTILLCRT